MAENLHKGHRERVRRKFIESGFNGFDKHEILELLLFYSRPRVNTNEIAHRLLDKFKTITAVCDADIDELKEISGIDESSAVLLKMIPLLSKEYLSGVGKNCVLREYSVVCDFFTTQFIGEREEKIRIACLDDKLRLIKCSVISDGVPGKVPVNIRKIVEFAFKNKSENIILAHNHPNGDAIPSDDDLRATSALYSALKPIGINLLDHIIVAGDDAISLKESGAFSLLK